MQHCISVCNSNILNTENKIIAMFTVSLGITYIQLNFLWHDQVHTMHTQKATFCNTTFPLFLFP